MIAALKAALQDAKARGFTWCKSRAANRWISQLLGAWRGKWRHLKVQSDFAGEIRRPDFIGQVRATIASLSGLFGRRKPSAHPQTFDAEFTEVPLRSQKRKSPSTSVKLVSGVGPAPQDREKGGR